MTVIDSQVHAWSAPLEWSDSNVSLAQVSTPA
jgi:hypothetical protein